MNAKLQSMTICCLLMTGLLLSACGLEELPAATPTPEPTLTPTQTPTSIPTLTRTPTPTDDPRMLNPENQHLYLYFGNGTTWQNAVNRCQTLGGYLVSVETASENDFVYKLSSGGNTWLGATDEIQEGSWVWTSGQPFDFKYWDEGEPNNCCPSQYCGGEACTPEHYLSFSGHGKTWNDMPRSSTVPFICEWEPVSP